MKPIDIAQVEALLVILVIASLALWLSPQSQLPSAAVGGILGWLSHGAEPKA